MHLLEEITVIATVSVIVTLLLGRLKLPVVAGLVLSGALVGPKPCPLLTILKPLKSLLRSESSFFSLPSVWNFHYPG